MATNDNNPIIKICIFTKNEEADIYGCLKAVKEEFENITVVDSGSSDSTIKIVEEMGCQVIHHHQKGPFDFAKQRNWFLSSQIGKVDYVLFVDADEFVQEGCYQILHDVILSDHHSIDCYEIPLLFRLHGKEIKSLGYPNWHDRLVKPTVIFDGGVVGDYAKTNSRRRVKDVFFLHDFNSKGFDRFVEKHMRYANYVARQLCNDDEPSAIFERKSFNGRIKSFVKNMGMIKPFLRFFYHYFLRLGVFEGKAGFLLAMHMMMYEYFIEVHRIEILRKRNGLKL